MSDQNVEFGKWVVHDGKGCPVHRGVMVHIQGFCSQGKHQEHKGPNDPDWVGWCWYKSRITRYRVALNGHVSMMKIKAKALDRVEPKTFSCFKVDDQ